MLYDKPLWQIMRDEAVPSLAYPFSMNDMVDWVLGKYPKFKRSTIQLHVRAMTANDAIKSHHAGRPLLFFRTGEGLYSEYDPERHGFFDEKGRPLSADSRSADETEDEEEEYEVSEESVGFALEQHLEEFIDANWERIDFGKPLKKYHRPDGRSGRQFRTDIGLIDFLCEDESTGSLVVIELKKGRSSDKVLGQCQRYMGWIQAHVAKAGQQVRGLIIAPDQDEKLKYALSVAPNVDMLCYKVNFHVFSPVSEEGG